MAEVKMAGTGMPATGALAAGAKVSPLNQIFDLLARVITFFSGLALVVLIAIFGWLVFGRYVLNSTPTWVEALSLLIISVITFLSAAVGIKENTHLSVEILPDLCPPRVRRWLRVLRDLLLAGFGSLMAFHSADLVAFSWPTRIPLINLPEGLRSLPMVICGILIVLFAGTRALRYALGGDEAEAAPSKKD